MKTTIKFIDADGYAATIEAEVKETSKGLAFSASGQYCGGAGQCLDSINPRTEAQRQLIDLWKKYHLNNMQPGTPRQIETVKGCKDYDEAVKMLKSINRETGAAMNDLTPHLEHHKEEAQKWEAEIKALEKWYNEDPILKPINEQYYNEKLKEYSARLDARNEKIKEIEKEIEKSLYFDIHPATGEACKYGAAWYFNPLPENFIETLENLIETIEEEEEERKGDPLTDLDDTQLLAIIEESTTFEGRDAELCAAFVRMFDLCLNDLADIEINDTRATVQGVDYLAGTDEEMNEAWDEELENYIDECILPDLKNESLNRYFDREAWKDDARHDGRAHALNRWDGGEEEASINNTYYYAYRQ
jgi:hypothetical protein